MQDSRLKFIGISAAALCALSASGADAGDRNVLILLQEGSTNSISVDQQGANDSQVGGVAYDSANNAFNRIDLSTNEADALANPVLQLGERNSADVTLTGEGGTVFLQQQGQTPNTDGFDNTANITVNSTAGGGNLAAVLQAGNNNAATIAINGSLSEANVLQDGNGNLGTVQVGDSNLPLSNVRATLTQDGNGNNTELQVFGINNSEYSYTVIGDNTTTSVPAVIITNGASVTITQSQIP